MSFAIDPKKTGSINEGGRKLKIGTFAYRIVSASYEANKSDPKGKEKQVVLGLQHIKDTSYECKLYLGVNSDNEATANIAQKTLVGITAAAGIEGIIKPETLKKLLKKIVVIEARENAGKGANKGKTYVNLATVEEYDKDTYSEDDDDSDDSDDDESEEEDEEDSDSEEEESDDDDSEDEEEEEEDDSEEEEDDSEEEEEDDKPEPPKKSSKSSKSDAPTKSSKSAPAKETPKKSRPW